MFFKTNNHQSHCSHRYVNGSVRHKRKKHFLYQESKNAFYIKFRGAGKNKTVRNDGEVAGMIKFEKKQTKTSSRGETVDRWTARVIIKNPEETGDNSRVSNTNSTSSVVILTENRWPRKTGVAESERERLQLEMKRARQEQNAQHLRRQREKAARRSLEKSKDFRLKHSGVRQWRFSGECMGEF